MIFYVYIQKRKDTGMVFYVGSAGEKIFKNPSKKYNRARDSRIERRGVYWDAVVKEAGGFEYEIIGEFKTDAEAREEELKQINKYGLESLVNVRKQAIKWSVERRSKHGQKGAEHPNFGKKFSKEVCKKKSEALKGENHHLYGKKLPDEWKKNIAKTKIGSKNPMYGRTGKDHPMSKTVKNTETGKIYYSVQEAADAEGHKMKTLYNWLSGHRKNPTSLIFD